MENLELPNITLNYKVNKKLSSQPPRNTNTVLVLPDIHGCTNIVLLLTFDPINNSNDRKIKVIHSEREKKYIHREKSE